MSQENQETVVAPVEVPVPVSPVVEMVDALIKQHLADIATHKASIATLRKLQKEFTVEVKELKKELSKRRKVKKPVDPTKKRKPSGFAAPFVVSDALYAFLEPLGVVPGTPIARTSVTKLITKYIKDNDLQNPEFRREIVPNDTLKAILGEPAELSDASNPESRKVYTYLQLQRYINPHFPKKQPTAHVEANA